MLDNKTEPTILLVEDEMPLLRAVQAKLRGSGNKRETYICHHKKLY
jgi:hypothetical protein